MNRALFIFILILSFFLICSCSTPIEEYKAKNDVEKEIVDFLINYTEAINEGDSEKISNYFHASGVYSAFGGNVSLSRDEMSKWKPEDWLSHGHRKIYNPEITINGNDAKVMAEVKYGNTSYTQIYALVKENNEWLIMKRE